VKKSSRLEEVGARKRHRVRLINKKLTYALDAVESLAPNEEMAARQAALKELRKAQRSLGQLNDDARYRVIAQGLQDGVENLPALLSAKRKKRLLHKAAEAYREFARLKAFRIPKTPVMDDDTTAGIPKSRV